MKILENPTSAKGQREYIFNKYMRGLEHKHIADLGCGKGELLIKLKNKNKVYAVDIKAYTKELNYIITDLNKKFPIKDSSLDLVYAIEVIEHIENTRHFLKECKRIIKPGQKIIITTPNLTHLKARIKFLLKGVLYGFDDREYYGSGHINPVFVTDFIRIADEVGLSILKMKKYKESTVVVMSKSISN
jgi:ubiquinone/menaquinone biosynthesis C-methylase UbiE